MFGLFKKKKSKDNSPRGKLREKEDRLRMLQDEAYKVQFEVDEMKKKLYGESTEPEPTEPLGNESGTAVREYSMIEILAHIRDNTPILRAEDSRWIRELNIYEMPNGVLFDIQGADDPDDMYINVIPVLWDGSNFLYYDLHLNNWEEAHCRLMPNHHDHQWREPQEISEWKNEGLLIFEKMRYIIEDRLTNEMIANMVNEEESDGEQTGQGSEQSTEQECENS